MTVAFYLPGSVPVYLFSLLIGLGATAGLAWVAGQTPRKEALRYVDIGLMALFGGLLGGRFAFVAADWAYYQTHLFEILAFPQGGISGVGALAGGLLGVQAGAALAGKPFWTAADAMLPLVACLAVTAWLGCWLVGCAYGPPTGAWWGLLAPDEQGALAVRWPLQASGALLALVLFALLDRARGKLTSPGLAAALGLLGISVEILALSFLRADPSPYWQGMRLESWGAAALAVLAGATIVRLGVFRR